MEYIIPSEVKNDKNMTSPFDVFTGDIHTIITILSKKCWQKLSSNVF